MTLERLQQKFENGDEITPGCLFYKEGDSIIDENGEEIYIENDSNVCETDCYEDLCNGISTFSSNYSYFVGGIDFISTPSFAATDSPKKPEN